MTGHLVSIAAVPDSRIQSILQRASEFADGAAPMRSPNYLGLLFLEPSLRTRTGFFVAAQRLGWPAPVEVVTQRSSDVSMRESLHDTAAVLCDYVDVLVARLERPIEEVVAVCGSTRIINAGDRGPYAQHPTQALIDLFAMERLVGDSEGLHVAVCGDPRMRSSRSLLELLARRPPRKLTLVTDSSFLVDFEPPQGLGDVQVVERFDDLSDADAIHLVGIAHGGAPESTRARLRVDRSALASLSVRGLVLSPMPVIDEVARGVRDDGRMAFLRQSALGLPLRMAVLEDTGSEPPRQP